MQENKDRLFYLTYGTSMFPILRPNEYILVKKIPKETIRPKDIVLFETDTGLKVCHRVTRIIERADTLWAYTRGDKNNVSDQVISIEKVVGKVIAVKRKNKFIPLQSQGIRYIWYRFSCFCYSAGQALLRFAKIHDIIRKIRQILSENLKEIMQ